MRHRKLGEGRPLNALSCNRAEGERSGRAYLEPLIKDPKPWLPRAGRAILCPEASAHWNAGSKTAACPINLRLVDIKNGPEMTRDLDRWLKKTWGLKMQKMGA